VLWNISSQAIYYYMCVLILTSVYVYTSIYVSSYYTTICVLILEGVCAVAPQLPGNILLYVSSHCILYILLYMCPRTSYYTCYHMCVLILLHAPRRYTTIYVSSYCILYILLYIYVLVLHTIYTMIYIYVLILLDARRRRALRILRIL
jgi:hypothetical protein